MNGRWTSALAMVLLLGVCGCRNLAPPSFSRPGPAQSQQSRAQRFDPYPENDPGPEIVGARPRGYERPPAEVHRARWAPWNRGGR